jgi:NADH-quinone oxidoreductase subunit M
MAKLGGGLLAAAPRLGALLVFASVASIGVPGLAGFWGEMLAMFSAYKPNPLLDRGVYLTFLAVAGLGSVLTATYFLVMLRRVAYGVVPARWRDVSIRDVTSVEWASWVPLVVIVVVFGLWPASLLAVTNDAVRSLLGGG